MRLRKAEQGREEVGSGTHLPLKLQTAQSRVAVLAKAVCLLSALFSAGKKKKKGEKKHTLRSCPCKCNANANANGGNVFDLASGLTGVKFKKVGVGLAENK